MAFSVLGSLWVSLCTERLQALRPPMKPDQFCSHVHTFQARLSRTFPCLFPCRACRCTDMKAGILRARPGLPYSNSVAEEGG